MSTIHPIGLYLSHPGHEADIVAAIAEHSRLLTVIRRCADAAELEAVTRAGLTQYVAIGADEPEIDRQFLERLHHAGAKILLLTQSSTNDNPHMPSEQALRTLGADAVAPADKPHDVLRALHQMVSPEQPPPHSGDSADTDPHPSDTTHRHTDNDFFSIVTADTTASPNTHAAEETSQDTTESITFPTRTQRHARSDTPQQAAPTRSEPAAEQPPHNARIIAVYGTSGSPGRTTVAVNVAAELAKNASVLLIDADTHAPSIAHTLGIDVDGSSVAALARAHARGSLNVIHCDEAAYDGPGGLQILTGLNSPHRWRELSPSVLAGIIDAARSGWDYVVIDLAAATFELQDDYQQHIPRRDALAARALELSDQIVILARADAIGLHRLRHTWEWLDEQGYQALRIPVVNMADSHRCGPQPVHSIAIALSELIPGASVTVIPYDTAVLHAVLKGQILTGKAKKNARAALVDLAARIRRSAACVVSEEPPAVRT